MLYHAWLENVTDGFAGFGCVMLVYLIASSLSRAFQDLRELIELYAEDKH